jgi:hypothetical protein
MSHVTSGWRFEPLKIVKILTKFGSIISCFPTAELDCDWRSKVSRWDDPGSIEVSLLRVGRTVSGLSLSSSTSTITTIGSTEVL